MFDHPSRRYTAAMVVAGALAVVGLWIPWVSKRPVGYLNGEPMYTLETSSRLETGFGYFDPLIVLLVGLVIAGSILLGHWGRRPDALLVTAGGLIFLVSSYVLLVYLDADRYAIEPGLYLMIASGLLFVLLGIGPVLKRRLRSSRGNNSNPQVG